MKSEGIIRRHIAAHKIKLQAGNLGIREKAVIEAQIATLSWIVNKTGFPPDSQVIDAMIDDYNNTLNNGGITCE